MSTVKKMANGGTGTEMGPRASATTGFVDLHSPTREEASGFWTQLSPHEPSPLSHAMKRCRRSV